jgi:cytochrome c
MRARSIAISAPLLLAAIASALGEEAGDPAAGKRLVEATCLQCHGAAVVPRVAPEFVTIAAMPSTSALSLGVFLQTSHPSMPNIILSKTERDDVIAYILSLRP